MTAEEIKAILKENINSIEDFAFEDFGPDDDFVFSSEVQAAKNLREATYNELINHPANSLLWRERETNEEYQALYKAYSDLPSHHDVMRDEWSESLGLGKIEVVANEGGEGQGEEWYIVFFFPKHNVYLKCNGYYQSYNGTEFHRGWGDCFEVTPKQIEITIYEKKLK